MKINWVAALAAVMASGSAHAQGPATAGPVATSRAGLREACQITASWNPQRQYEQQEALRGLECSTYLRGVMDGIMAANIFDEEMSKRARRPEGARFACPSSAYEVRMVAAAVLSVLDQPSLDSKAPPGVIAALAVQKTFPCN